VSIYPPDRSEAESVAAVPSPRKIDLSRTLGQPVPGPSSTWGVRSTHTALMAVDICAFGDRHDEDVQLHLREKMYELLAETFKMTQLPWERAYHEDRGDGALIILPPAVPAEALLDPLAHHLHALLRRSNRFASDAARLRMRVAIHSGEVYADPHGVAGHAVILLFRLLNCGRFKKMLAAGGADVALIVSASLYHDTTHRAGLVDAVSYQQITVRNKETSTRAWVWLPPQCRVDH
jgi:class 3 adenylate cyclase